MSAGLERQENVVSIEYFTEENSVACVLARMNWCRNERFREVMTSVITHLHAVVKEVEPTIDEWMEAIQFLTETGKICDERRQEFILMSDTLGVSMLVDAINHRKPSGRPRTPCSARFMSRVRRGARWATIFASTAKASRSP